MDGRRYSDGLHQAIEAKENVKWSCNANLCNRYVTELFQNVQQTRNDWTAVTEAGDMANIQTR
jgi:preprotein translocase subunit SecA